ncbi:hypothetical protein ZWY2020_037907 [Hordeum vulgare]|nr:hypothetical protein ZWY2020_037907 [Hordeum vulgare]
MRFRQQAAKKRRRTDSAPAGRADGMAMDDLSWPRNPRPQHADGVAIVVGWASTCGVRRTTTQPGRASFIPCSCRATMGPWHCRLAIALKEKCKGVFRTTTAPDKAGLSPIPRPTDRQSRAPPRACDDSHCRWCGPLHGFKHVVARRGRGWHRGVPWC